MELLNATGMQAGYTLGLDPDGRERAVVVVKGTFDIPEDPEAEPRFAEEQVPLVMADEFTGEPGFSAVLYESEYAPFKPRCDVLLNGSAHAPWGRPAYEVRVGLRLGPIQKSFNVVGDRVWKDAGVTSMASSPEAFVTMPISYDRAYGGMDVSVRDPEKKDAYTDNPIGVGYYPLQDAETVAGRPLPNTEEVGKPATSTNGKFKPMSFGVVGRNFAARIPLAGTYDQAWIDDVFPFLPEDFDPLYHQSAPADQQMEYPKGGEWVELENLTPAGETRFRLPHVQVPVEFTDEHYERQEMEAVIDSVLIEPDERRFMMLWRASRPLRKNLFELRQCVVGRMPKGWYRARALGKDYYPSLSVLVASRRGEEIDVP